MEKGGFCFFDENSFLIQTNNNKPKLTYIVESTIGEDIGINIDYKYDYPILTIGMNINSKSTKILFILNKIGKTGTANLLSHFQRNFPKEYMTRKLLVSFLDQLTKFNKVKKEYGRRNKQFWGYNPQLYEVTNNGKVTLDKLGLINNNNRTPLLYS